MQTEISTAGEQFAYVHSPCNPIFDGHLVRILGVVMNRRGHSSYRVALVGQDSISCILQKNELTFLAKTAKV